MAFANPINVTCTTIAAIFLSLVIIIIIRCIFDYLTTKLTIKRSLWILTFTTIVLYGFCITFYFISFMVSTLSGHSSNTQAIARIGLSFYTLSSVSMLYLWIKRIECTFQNSFFKYSISTIRKLKNLISLWFHFINISTYYSIYCR